MEKDIAWQKAMDAAEDKILKLSGVCKSLIKKGFITIQKERNPFRVRTFHIGADTTKKTLVLIHGYTGASVLYYKMLYKLSQEYRVVMFDHGSWGLNTRLEQSSGLASADAAEAWMIDFIEQVFQRLDLPSQFYLAGHSYGGWMGAIYASLHPERVSKLFLISPAGTQPYDSHTYDPYKLRDPTDLTKDHMDRKEVDKMLQMDINRKHWLGSLPKLPQKVLYKAMLVQVRSDSLLGGNQPEHEIEAVANYLSIAYQRLSVVDVLQRLPFKYSFYAIKPLQGTDRLGNPKIKFPIGIAFGDRDFFGSDKGADEMVKQNINFSSGQSQLFNFYDCSHNLIFDQPDLLADIMIGFDTGTVTHRYQEKPRNQITLRKRQAKL